MAVLMFWFFGWTMALNVVSGLLKLPRWSWWMGFLCLVYIYLTHIPSS